jgi:site-specific recombinase XerD
MNEREVKKAIEVLGLRERVVVKLGVVAGMRVSEIFGLRRGRVKDGYVEIKERVCKRDVDVVMRPADAGLLVQIVPGSNHTHGFHG